MNATRYAAKVAAGQCAWGTCTKPRTAGAMCPYHRKKHRKHSKKSSAKRRAECKEQGLCTACHKPARDDANLCGPCSKRNDQRKITWTKSANGREKHRAYIRSWRAERTRKGICRRCNRPLATKTLCEVHRKEVLARWRKAKGPTRMDKCSRCHQPGHRVTTCKELDPMDRPLAPLPPLRIEDFATARQEVAA